MAPIPKMGLCGRPIFIVHICKIWFGYDKRGANEKKEMRAQKLKLCVGTKAPALLTVGQDCLGIVLASSLLRF
jgi:hypothetical protein